ncbi:MULTISPECIES: hypothetical protein [unclassified Variovorax]|uniref:hypothetical protein n=1 Tax=unclassified Variovorax TaxID=663243 RepID=UPI00076D8C1A|nr:MULTISPECIES: hypothetical protein [unclassified Variovorax]KWT98434.1 hypothetical protein APY03_0569 [Variovorax sp. WDL1]PNG49897.1 hypothetical protein CHC06_05478 [Variovorax sp. B2]PNG50769.1 hypothetical protein CHC07_05383 [Variovorax sp. B4]VTU42111.1 hypothetical protein H6P1_00111 [Variovorax sp. PBL-H6]VTU44242.1 hypothetical protein SRS16P1_00791 [Variovorax sp. SRS16]
MDAELRSLAVDVLLPAWGWRWAFIIGVGVLPFALPAILPLQWKDVVKSELQHICGVVGLMLCFLSFGLAVDTVLVEARSSLALVETQCKVAQAPDSRWSRLQCDPGGFYFVEKPIDAAPGETLLVTHLRMSGWALKAERIAP